MSNKPNENIPGKEVKSNFINRFHVLSNKNYSRLLLGECIDGQEINYHTAITMSFSDLKELSELLNKVINEISNNDK